MNHQGFFPQTSWSTVLPPSGAGPETRLAALDRLLTRYRRPILLEMQSRTSHALGDAEDLTQQFIHDCLRREFLKNVDPRKGRFRNFIKGCIANFLNDQHDKLTAQKRGQGILPASVDERDEEGNLKFDPAAGGEPPEVALDRAWAGRVVELALAALEQECSAARRRALFSRLRPFLQSDDPDGDSYAKAAADLGMEAGAVRTAVSRMRQRLGEIIEEEIKQTVSSEEDWLDELRYFLELLGRNSSVTGDAAFRLGR